MISQTAEIKNETPTIKDKPYDVGIVGFWYGLNYGSILTSYALYRVVESLGYSAVHLDKPKIMWAPRFEDKTNIPNQFIRSRCNVLESDLSLEEINANCETFLLGSDTVWNVNVTGKYLPFFFLDFVQLDKKKITYASSFGRPHFEVPDPGLKAYAKFAVSRLDEVSVRERSGVSVMKKEFGRDVDLVLDPVFLLPFEEYRQIGKDGTMALPEQYIFIHILDLRPKNIELYHNAVSALKIPAIMFANLNMNKEKRAEIGLDFVENESMENWIQSIDNASLVVTTSFHATCFSIILNTNFIAFTPRDVPGRTRFETLLTLLGLEDRLFCNEDEIPFKEIQQRSIDYNRVNAVLYHEQLKSRDWLATALNRKKNTGSATSTELEKITAYLKKELWDGKLQQDKLQNKLMPMNHLENMPKRHSGLSGKEHLAGSFLLRMAFRIEYLRCTFIHKLVPSYKRKKYIGHIKALEIGHRLLFRK